MTALFPHSTSSFYDSTHTSPSHRSYATVRRSDPDDNYDTMTAVSRKRPRIDSRLPIDKETQRPSLSFDVSASISSIDGASPAPLVNTDYLLAGGFDTPGAWSAQRVDTADERDAERDYRHNRFMDKPSERSDVAPLQKSRTGRGTAGKTDQNEWHIGRTAWALTGGLAGKIINFCWSTTFKGFRAGGGPAYTDCAPAVKTDSPTSHDPWLQRSRSQKIPGSFPATRRSLDGQDYEHDERMLSQQTPTAANHQTADDSSARCHWVFVEHSRAGDSDVSPIRKKVKASVDGAGRFGSPRSTHQSRAHTASFASPRSRTTTATSLYVRQHSAGRRPRTSLASPTNRRQSSLFVDQNSPVSPEIEQYRRKRRKEDKKHDESLRRLNAQLQDMIREGQQALGSKIELVDDQDMDEGYFDGESY